MKISDSAQSLHSWGLAAILDQRLSHGSRPNMVAYARDATVVRITMARRAAGLSTTSPGILATDATHTWICRLARMVAVAGPALAPTRPKSTTIHCHRKKMFTHPQEQVSVGYAGSPVPVPDPPPVPLPLPALELKANLQSWTEVALLAAANAVLTLPLPLDRPISNPS